MGRTTFFLASLLASPLLADEVSRLDLGKVFEGSPLIYSVLILLSVSAFVLWLYSLLTLKLSDMCPKDFVNTLREQLSEKRFTAALETCENDGNFAAKIIASGLSARKHGSAVMIDAMQSEGKRMGCALWQRISLLSDIAVVAPMLGLLGTVLGMFFAFYDTNRTSETITQIFDGLGIAIGTTVVGLIVAILAMVFHTTLKFRLITLLNAVENEALSLVNLVETEG